ncbi:MAG: ABC transporter permease [Acidimicrobiales bacterium]
MDLLNEVVDWFSDSGNWEGPRGVPQQLYEHVRMSAVAMVAACLLALPAAVWLGHRRRFGTIAVNVSNVGRAIPSFAILVIGTERFGLLEYPVIGSFTTFLALIALAVPPLVTNGYVAVAEVPDDLRDAAHGMGMSDLGVLRRVELPVAAPLLMAGVRTAAVQVVATATIAAFVGAEGLGRFIIDGRAVNDQAEIFAGALLVALLSLLTEGGLAIAQSLVTPRGLRQARVPTGAEAAALAAAPDPTPDGRGTL